jgi:hypothetical protein
VTGWPSTEARLAQVFGLVAAGLTFFILVGWLVPGILAATGWLLLGGFVFDLIGVGLAITAVLVKWNSRQRYAAMQFGQSSRLRVPKRAGLLLGTVALGGLAALAVGSAQAGDYYAATPGSLGCAWPTTTDHGSVVKCVSHRRYSRVEHGNGVAVLAGVALLACIEASALAARLSTPRIETVL